MRVSIIRSLRQRGWWFGVAFALAMTIGWTQPAWALIVGGEGNDPMHDPGWPKGAAAVFNTQSRVAFWEGPPFGGGQYHAECRGDTEAFQRVLDEFAKIDNPFIRVVLHDGVGKSFWLNTNQEKEKAEKAKVDWIFMVWQPERRNMQRRLPVGISAIGKHEPAIIAQLDVYTGGSIHWKDVVVPEGIEVIDQRLETHGFTTADGTVLEGTVIDIATRKPLKASLILQRIEPQKQGGYAYTNLVEVASDSDGHWTLKNAPQEWCRLLLTADGYAPRVIGYGKYDDQPHWSEHNSGLSKPGIVTGRVVDSDGQPLADVDVRIDAIEVKSAGAYESLSDSTIKTDAEGRFSFEVLPLGTAKVRVHKPGYIGHGMGNKIEIPASDLKLEMQLAAKLRVSIDFSETKRAGGYLVHIEPEGGEQVGKWSGDGDINANNEFICENIPQGRYVVTSRPNPGSTDQQTDPITVDLKGGATTEVTIKSK